MVPQQFCDGISKGPWAQRAAEFLKGLEILLI
jgi:hypothetical protein